MTCRPWKLLSLTWLSLRGAVGSNASHYPYEDLISETVAYCYRALVRDSGCCLDQKYGKNVRRKKIRRPGVGWLCDKACYDDLKGFRGDDVLWIPQGATCESPRLLWIHGGSWEYGSPDTLSYGQLASKIAELSGAIVMVPDFPLAPVGNYHVIMRASLDALRWLAETDLDMNCPEGSAPLLVGGDSAGGGTAVSLIFVLKQGAGWTPQGVALTEPERVQKAQSLAGGIFFSPWTNLKCDTPDYYYNAFAKIVDKKAFKDPSSGVAYVGDLMFRGHPEENLDEFTANAKSYIGSNADLLTDPVASPFWTTEQELGGGGVPPMLFAVGGSESILGDSMIVAQKAAFYGASVHVDVHVGMWHDFPMYSEGCGSGEGLWQAALALNRTAAFIREVARRKRTASAMGLVWPPASSRAGTPKTRYIYDVTRPGAQKWFPKKLLSPISNDVHFEALPPIPAASRDDPLPTRSSFWALIFLAVSGMAQVAYFWSLCTSRSLQNHLEERLLQV